MRIILREDMENLGKAGEVVSVREGYWRNYLLPRGMAVRPPRKMKLVSPRTATDCRAGGQTGQGTAVGGGSPVAGFGVGVPAVGEGDKLYGSVTSRDIAEALAEQGSRWTARRSSLTSRCATWA